MGLGWTVMDTFSRSVSGPSEDDPPSDDDGENGNALTLRVTDGTTDNGSDLKDFFLPAPSVDGTFTANLNGGAGDDVFRL